MRARRSYAVYGYDAADRPVAAADLGTNGGAAPSGAGLTTVPARSDDALVTSWDYDDAGRPRDATDPRGVVTRTAYDALGRVTRVVEALSGDGTPTDDANRTTDYAHNGVGDVLRMTAVLPGGAVQETEYAYGVKPDGANPSGVSSNRLLGAVLYPDPATGLAGAGQRETFAYNLQGERAGYADRNGTAHLYAYDALGRLTSDAVTAFGAGVDQAVKSMTFTYDEAGRPLAFVSRAADGSAANAVERRYDGLGRLAAEFQSHDGAVDPAADAAVRYDYDLSRGGRLKSMAYPNGRVVDYRYEGADDRISRLTAMVDGDGTRLEAYGYLGLGTTVGRYREEPGFGLGYAKRAGEADGDAGDQYAGLDRFGRVVDRRWSRDDGAAVDRFAYGHDRSGNRTFRDDLLFPESGEAYAYDALDRLTGTARGTLNAAKDGVQGATARTQAWELDALGNWDAVATDGAAEARGHDAQNRIVGAGYAYSPNGELLADPSGQAYAYDAWGRTARVDPDGAAGPLLAVAYEYDALGRRTQETRGGATTDLYHSAAGQVVEERARAAGAAESSAATSAQYVWSPDYVNSLVLRDDDSDGDGTLDRRLYAQQDANHNVTSVADRGGAVVERYRYDAYGERAVLDAQGTPRPGNASAVGMRYAFQGGRADAATQLVHFNARDLHVHLGRWTRQDPAGYVDGANRLQFVSSRPLSFVDSDGREGQPTTKPTTPPVGAIPYSGNAGKDAAAEEAYIKQIAPSLNDVWYLRGDAGLCGMESFQLMENIRRKMYADTGKREFDQWDVDALSASKRNWLTGHVIRWHTVVVVYPKPSNKAGRPFILDHWQRYQSMPLGDWMQIWDMSKTDTPDSWDRVLCAMGQKPKTAPPPPIPVATPPAASPERPWWYQPIITGPPYIF